VRLTEPLYRAHNPRWGFLPSSGEGAAIAGGRFNPVGVPALYTSFRIETAWLEAQQSFAFKAQPMILCGYDVDCEDILNLTSHEIRQQNKIEFEDLACPWKDLATRGVQPPSWAMAQNLRAQKIAGIAVPSFAKGAGANDINVVFWKWGDSRPHKVKVVDDHNRLPKDMRSWT
jgi:RES domain-containing protein